MEEKLKFLEKHYVDIDAKEGGEKFIVCHDNINDEGPLGYYPIWSEFDSFDEAVNFCYDFIQSGYDVNSISNSYN